MALKKQTVIDSCSNCNGLSPMDKQFLRDLQELFCNDITGNPCHLTIYRSYHIFLDRTFYPNSEAGGYIDDKSLTTREQIDLFNAQLEDFFKRNEIEGDEFLIYVNW